MQYQDCDSDDCPVTIGSFVGRVDERKKHSGQGVACATYRISTSTRQEASNKDGMDSQKTKDHLFPNKSKRRGSRKMVMRMPSMAEAPRMLPVNATYYQSSSVCGCLADHRSCAHRQTKTAQAGRRIRKEGKQHVESHSQRVDHCRSAPCPYRVQSQRKKGSQTKRIIRSRYG